VIAAVYARKSTDQNGVAEDQKSVARQVEHARLYAKGKDWALPDEYVFVDDGVSGAEFANRPAFLRLMNSLKPQPPFGVLIMSEESRLGREQIEVSYALKQLVQADVRVYCYLTDTERTLDSPIDKVMLSLTAFADELERDKGRQRTMDAMVRKARARHVCGGRCFGYDNVEITGPDGKRSHVQRRINEEEAEVVREIFRQSAAGYGATRIAKTLNERGALTPRPQQGRPAAWAPSSIGGVLNRDLYRGVVIWNKTKKRNSWGQMDRKARPEAEWIREEAPELRIVPEELWDKSAKRRATTRKNYLRQTNGQLWGRPCSGVAGRYLLTGITRCSHCGASLEVRSRSHGKKRAFYYACSSFYRRGKAICPVKFEIPMALADRAVIETLLEQILTPERLATVAQRTLELAKAEQATPGLREQLEGRLKDAQRSLAQLAAAVAAGGGDIPALVKSLKEHEAQRELLEQRLEALNRPEVTFDAEMEQRLTAAVEEWREILGRQVPVARQIVTKLLDGRITFTPEERDGHRGFRFTATGTVEKLVEGVVPGSFRAGASPTGFEPVERSWEGAFPLSEDMARIEGRLRPSNPS